MNNMYYMTLLHIHKVVQNHIVGMSLSVLSDIMHHYSGVKRMGLRGYKNSDWLSPLTLQRRGWQLYCVAMCFRWDQAVHDDLHTLIFVALVCLVQESSRVVDAYAKSISPILYFHVLLHAVVISGAAADKQKSSYFCVLRHQIHVEVRMAPRPHISG